MTNQFWCMINLTLFGTKILQMRKNSLSLNILSKPNWKNWKPCDKLVTKNKWNRITKCYKWSIIGKSPSIPEWKDLKKSKCMKRKGNSLTLLDLLFKTGMSWTKMTWKTSLILSSWASYYALIWMSRGLSLSCWRIVLWSLDSIQRSINN